MAEIIPSQKTTDKSNKSVTIFKFLPASGIS